MFPKIKLKIIKDKADNKGILYLFKDRAQFERCIASGCKLFSPDNAFDASELTFSMDLVSSLAIELWRLEKRIDKVKNSIDNSITDQFQRIKDILRKQEIEICEHTNADYNDGMSVKVLHVEDVDNLPPGKMKIIETVKPSIYSKGKVISHGEVIVGKSTKKEKE